MQIEGFNEANGDWNVEHMDLSNETLEWPIFGQTHLYMVSTEILLPLIYARFVIKPEVVHEYHWQVEFWLSWGLPQPPQEPRNQLIGQ